MQQLVEEAHTAINATGGPIIAGPGSRTIPRHVLRPDARAVSGVRTRPAALAQWAIGLTARRGRRDRVAARDDARRRRRAIRPSTSPRRLSSCSRWQPARSCWSHRSRRRRRVGGRGSRRDLPVRRHDPRALGLVVPADRDRARPGLPHGVDHEVRALRRTRRLRVQGPPSLLPAVVLLAARPPRGAGPTPTPTRHSRSACSSARWSSRCARSASGA